jgi:hypothetical protein
LAFKWHYLCQTITNPFDIYMKRFLTLLFIVAASTFAGKLHAQVSTEKPKADTAATESNKKSDAGKVTPTPGSGEGITIDESGTPKPKHKKQHAAKSADPKRAESKQSAKSDDAAPSPGSSGEIAIDESGSSKPKPKAPRANAPSNEPPNKDTAITNQVGRPQ